MSMSHKNRIVDWRLTGILAVLWSFNLFQAISFGRLCDFSNFWEYRDSSLLELVFGAPQYSLVVLPAVWIAMAGSPRPWRWMFAAVAGSLVVSWVIVAIVSWGDIGYGYYSEPAAVGPVSLFFLTLVASMVLVSLRLWGWNVEDVRSRGDWNGTGAPDRGADVVAARPTGRAGAKVQFSLTGLLLWGAALAVGLSVLSTLVGVVLTEQKTYTLVFLTMSCGYGVVLLTPLVLGITLGERFWVGGLVLLGLAVVLLVLVFVLVPPAPGWTTNLEGAVRSAALERTVPRAASIFTITSVIWTGLQLLLVRAAGYRFRREAKGPEE